ncbi:MAG: oligopeptide/dipeptide ABC transporter ATP-binding protein [Sulfitobacter sp.]
MTDETRLSDPLVTVKNAHCVFNTNQRETLFGPAKKLRAVSGVSFDIFRGEVFGVVGESGCGKSTTAKLILNMASASEGEIIFNGQSLLGLSDTDWKPLRRRIQYVFQDPLGALDPRMVIFDQVVEPLTIHDIGTRDNRKTRASEILELVGLRPHQFSKYPHELSGGQRQRVVLARALILEPELLVCDEPISALDVSIQAQIINLLQKLRREMGLTIMFISHDLSVVRHLCDRLAVMYLGKIVEQGSTNAIFTNPRHPYTQALISAIPVPQPDAKPSRIFLQGEPPSPIDPPLGCRFHPRCHLADATCKSAEPEERTMAPGHVAACFRATAITGEGQS